MRQMSFANRFAVYRKRLVARIIVFIKFLSSPPKLAFWAYFSEIWKYSKNSPETNASCKYFSLFSNGLVLSLYRHLCHTNYIISEEIEGKILELNLSKHCQKFIQVKTIKINL